MEKRIVVGVDSSEDTNSISEEVEEEASEEDCLKVKTNSHLFYL